MNNMPDRAALDRGRQEMKERCKAIALANTPASVRRIKIRRSLTGHASFDGEEMSVPRPFTRRALFMFLHECAHITLGHKGRRHAYIEEYEAETWAIAKMRETGIPVPAKEVRRAKGYVAWKLRQGLKRGLQTVDKKIARWAGVQT